MLGFIRIHNAGIIHGNLVDESHIGRVGYCPRIISFSRAKRHRCKGCPPVDDQGHIPRGVSLSTVCPELYALEKHYGLKSSDLTAVRQEKPKVEEDASMTQLGNLMARLKFVF